MRPARRRRGLARSARRRVSMLPRSGSISREGSSASSCARRRTEAVPIRIAGRSAGALQSASRGSSRGGYAPTTSPATSVEVMSFASAPRRRCGLRVAPPRESLTNTSLPDLAERTRSVTVAKSSSAPAPLRPRAGGAARPPDRPASARDGYRENRRAAARQRRREIVRLSHRGVHRGRIRTRTVGACRGKRTADRRQRSPATLLVAQPEQVPPTSA